MKRIEELEALIQRHKILYYQGKPEISDAEYDGLEEELKRLDPENMVLQSVGSLPKGSNKVSHKTKMLSLDKTYVLEDLESWAKGEVLLSTYKIDGVSCSLIYIDGVLDLAKTRGNGSIGENITPKALWIESIPKKLRKQIEGEVEVRGEIFCEEENFFSLSEEMESIGLEKPTSMRNIVAGLISRKENLELCRYLHFNGFEIMGDELDIETEEDKFKTMTKLGIDLPDFKVHKKFSTVSKYIEKASDFMSHGHLQIDGVVFTLNNLSLHEEMGETAHHPRYKMAFKFKGEEKVTTIEEIEWSISRNGILTPVGNVKPVDLSGAKISRVTLHNYGMVKNHNLKVGDEIEIIRSGEVIPKFQKVIKSSDKEFTIPDKCPWCQNETVIDDIRLRCKNEKCPGKQKEIILNFIKKIGMDDISSKRLDEMINKGLLKGIPDLYRLSKEDFLTLDKVKNKLADKFIKTIEGSKKVDLPTFLSSLGILGGAKNNCEKVVDAGFDTMPKLKKMTIQALAEVPGFAEKSSSDFVNSFNDKLELVDELLELGFEFEKSKKSSGSQKLKGKKFVITGTLNRKRSEIENLIKSNGGAVVGSVSRNTDYLVTNDTESNSSKFRKAKELDLPIINEDKLDDLMN